MLNINKILNSAIKKGDLTKIQSLIDRGANIGVDNNAALKLAVIYGHLDVVTYFVGHGGQEYYVNSNEAIKLAVQYGYTEISDYLLSLGTSINDIAGELLNVVAKTGNDVFAAYLINNYDIDITDGKALKIASENDKLKVVKLLVESNTVYTEALLAAAKNANLDVVRYLITNESSGGGKGK